VSFARPLHPISPVWQLLSTQTESPHTKILADLNGYSEGDYAVKIEALDFAQSQSQKKLEFKIDNTAPKTKFIQPFLDSYVSSSNGLVPLIGSIVEANPFSYKIRVASVTTPENFFTLVDKAQFPLPEPLGHWDVSSLNDGEYSLEFSAIDKAGLYSKTTQSIHVDNTAPISQILAPINLSYVTEVLNISGIATDSNFSSYTLLIASGALENSNVNELKYSQLIYSTNQVNNGALTFWQALPKDGNYILKLMVTDIADNVSVSFRQVIVDTTKPKKPQSLSYSLENTRNIRLIWNNNSESDIAGYIVKRAGVDISGLLTTADFLVQNALDGAYEYSVVAVDKAGLKSDNSDSVKVVIDVTPPTSSLISPFDGAVVSSLVEITGTAGSKDFKEYRLYVSSDNTEKQLLNRSTISVESGTLSQWSTHSFDEGSRVTIQLEVEDLSGNVAFSEIQVVVDNQAPSRPVGLILSVTDNNVQLNWQANNETDLIGYIIYRDDSLLNISGAIDGELQSYAISETQYLDALLEDGSYQYSVVALDSAGNISSPSGIQSTTIDLKSPIARIISPTANIIFEQPITLVAESNDKDLASIQFQLKQGLLNWMNINQAVIKHPFETVLNPTDYGLTHGSIKVRAIATDQGGLSDTSPLEINIEYKDLTKPNSVEGLQTSVTGNLISLSWTANQELDIASYIIIMKAGNNAYQILGTANINETTFEYIADTDNLYTFYIVAKDQNGNNGVNSDEISALVYTPKIKHPETPTVKFVTQLTGQGPDVTTISGEIINSDGTSYITPFDSELDGTFSLDNITLLEGQNRIVIRLLDSEGNLSKDAVVFITNGEIPSKPTGLSVVVNDLTAGFDWNDNPEINMLGYNIFDQSKNILESTLSIIDSQLASSISGARYHESYVSDGLDNTSWAPSINYASETPGAGEWIQLSFAEKQLVSKIEIDWLYMQGRALDFQIQAWTGESWVTISEIIDNKDQKTVILLNENYYTQQVRIVLSKLLINTSGLFTAINEIRVFEQPLITLSEYSELTVDGIHQYTVTAVNQLGFESLPSDFVDVNIGDITPPDAVELSFETFSSDISLSWSESLSADLAYYEIFRDELLITIVSDLSIVNYLDVGLENGIYNYHVVSVDNTGNKSISNVITAALNVNPPEAPTDLLTTVVVEGRSLQLTWTHPNSQSISSYELFVSGISGGEYLSVTKVNDLNYLHTDIENGKNYFYVIVAFDEFGNPSAYSNEVIGTPSDSVSPIIPNILYPASGGSFYQLKSSSVTVSGLGERGSVIQLLRNAVKIGEFKTSSNASIKDATLNTNAYISKVKQLNNGEQFIFEARGAYGNSSSDIGLYIYDFKSSTVKNLAVIKNESNMNYRLSYDNRTIIFTEKDSSTQNKFVKSVDIESGKTIQLTSTVDTNISHAVLSPNNQYLVGYGYVFTNEQYGNGLWLFDIENKRWLQFFSSGYNFDLSSIQWSPDNRYISFINGNGLSIYDTQTEVIIAVDENALNQSPQWSKDSQQLLYSYESVNGSKISSYNVANQSDNLLAKNLLGNKPIWLVGTNSIYYIENSVNIIQYDIQSDNSNMTYKVGEYDLIDSIQASERGELLALIENDDDEFFYRKISPGGFFEFKNVPLSHGENAINVSAVDSSNNVSAESETLVVTYNVTNLVDFEISVDDIQLLPQLPVKGELASVSVRANGL